MPESARTLVWQVRNERPLDVWVHEADGTMVGRMVVPTDEPNVAYAEVDGTGWRVAWTDHRFYRVARTEGGAFVGEARYLPWKRRTFQATFGGVRVYRWTGAGWTRDERPVVAFGEGEARLADHEDAPPLMILGLLRLLAEGDRA